MNMNNPLENLRQLTEAVRMAGADIAPTYIEYVQLAFAIANDCGEAGRNDFLSLLPFLQIRRKKCTSTVLERASCR